MAVTGEVSSCLTRNQIISGDVECGERVGQEVLEILPPTGKHSLDLYLCFPKYQC